MGALDEKVFKQACKERFPASEAKIKAEELFSLWREKVMDPAWHPFKVAMVDGKEKVM